jgi:hypothetical protein
MDNDQHDMCEFCGIELNISNVYLQEGLNVEINGELTNFNNDSGKKAVC